MVRESCNSEIPELVAATPLYPCLQLDFELLELHRFLPNWRQERQWSRIHHSWGQWGSLWPLGASIWCPKPDSWGPQGLSRRQWRQACMWKGGSGRSRHRRECRHNLKRKFPTLLPLGYFPKLRIIIAFLIVSITKWINQRKLSRWLWTFLRKFHKVDHSRRDRISDVCPNP